MGRRMAPARTGRLRVVAGSLKGRKLRTASGSGVRPTADRVREALFDILGDRIGGSAFLDAYAGTGAVGIEALSRGAASAAFIERQREIVDLLRRNLEVAGDLAARARVLPWDLARAVAALEMEGGAFDILFLDPPYGGGELERGVRLLSRSRLLGQGALLIVEHSSHQPPPAFAWLEPARTVAYGRAALTFYGAPGAWRIAGRR